MYTDFFMNSEILYKEFFVWKPIDDKSVLRYRCFEILANGKFFVMQSDHFFWGFNRKTVEWIQYVFLRICFRRKFFEQANEACETIEEAITKFESGFDEVYEEFDELKKHRKK